MVLRQEEQDLVCKVRCTKTLNIKSNLMLQRIKTKIDEGISIGNIQTLSIRLGKFKQPVSLEEQTSFK